MNETELDEAVEDMAEFSKKYLNYELSWINKQFLRLILRNPTISLIIQEETKK